MDTYEWLMVLIGVAGVLIAIFATVYVAKQTSLQTKISQEQASEIKYRNQQRDNDRYIYTVKYIKENKLDLFFGDLHTGTIEKNPHSIVITVRLRKLLDISYEIHRKQLHLEPFIEFENDIILFYHRLVSDDILNECEEWAWKIKYLTEMVEQLKKHQSNRSTV